MVDSREPVFYRNELRKRGVSVFVRYLDYGDFMVVSPKAPTICIERKTSSDFAGSILDKRLFNQVVGIMGCDYAVVLIEGSLYKAMKFSSVKLEVLVGALTRLVVGGVSVVSLPSKWWTVEFLRLLDEKVRSGDLQVTVKAKEKAQSWEARSVLIGAVQSVPGIGKKTALKIADRYGSLAELIEDGGAKLVGILSNGKLKRLRQALGIEEI